MAGIFKPPPSLANFIESPLHPPGFKFAADGLRIHRLFRRVSNKFAVESRIAF
jgi:hypothetical protein